MGFREAFNVMRGRGKPVKLGHWDGYWIWAHDTIMMHCRDGSVLDIRDTQNVEYTINNALTGGWEIATPENCAVLRREMEAF